MFKLVIADDEGKNTVVPLVREEITIGRKEGNTIRLTERNISRRHARLVKANGRFVIEDLHSYNGVRVNGQRIGAETALEPGDQIQIGDYQLALQLDGADSATIPEQISVAVTDAQTAMIASPGPPARLVMVTPPAPGAEFVLSSERVRIGRAEDLDVWVNHRSISREHAEIQKEPDGGLRLIDLGSANGVRVNGSDVQNALLHPGDIVELGQVRFRFVGAGEHYAFDADRTVQVDAVALERPSSNRLPLFAALGIVSLAIVGAIAVAFWPGAPEGGEASNGEIDSRPIVPNPTVAAPTFEQSLASCRSSIAGSQFANAIEHANAALAQRPSDLEADRCRAEATDLQAQEQAFQLGLGQLQRGEFQAAYFTFEGLPQESSYRSRPEIGRAVQGYARLQLTAGEGMLETDACEARRLAQFVLTMNGITDDQRGVATALEAAARGRCGAPAEPLIASNTPPANNNNVRPENTDRRRPNANNNNPRRNPNDETSRPNTEEAAPRPEPEEASSPDQQVRDCAGRGDNACIIRLLENRARSEFQMAMLIEAYRARGQSTQAVRHMRNYVDRFPNTSRARNYQQIINRHAP
jgi:ABC transport system ATP-binding/permease protein